MIPASLEEGAKFIILTQVADNILRSVKNQD
jgi:hypothetical protein